MARQSDRRVQRTRKMLREALMSLILEEGYDEISIQDITDKANLGRATFYLHFKDKDELLQEVMNRLMEELLEQVPQLSETQWLLDDTRSLIKLFDFAAQHYDLYRILIFGSGGITASRQLRESIASRVEASIQAEIDQSEVEPLLPAAFIANFFAGALLSTIYWWLDNDLPYPVEEIARLFLTINQVDRDTLFGLNQESSKKDLRSKGRRKRKEKEPAKVKNETTATQSEGDEVPEQPTEIQAAENQE